MYLQKLNHKNLDDRNLQEEEMIWDEEENQDSKKNLSEEDKDKIVNEISLVTQDKDSILPLYKS